MKEFWNVVQAIFAAVGGWLGYFLGGCDGLLYALLAFVVLDYITGIMCAVADKKLSSAVGFKGICRKVLIFALVGIGHLLDTHIFGEAGVLRTAIIFRPWGIRLPQWAGGNIWASQLPYTSEMMYGSVGM